MKTSISLKLAVSTLVVMPVVALAVPPTTSPYYTDVTSSYVQDQTSEAMSRLNSILCNMADMDPAEMVNLGDYIALIDDSVCNPNSGGGKGSSSNTGASYQPAVVNSSRTDNASPMIVKVWLNQLQQGSTVKAYASATQAPNPPADPYGRFRMDYIQSGAQSGKGFINATATGLDFYQDGSGSGGGGGTYSETLQLKLNTSTTTTGSGSLRKVATFNSVAQPTVSFDFAYNATNFLRTDSTGTTQLCFSRDPLQADESVWSYGLYDSTTGDRINRNSGFPITYTDTTGKVQNGYAGYWGLSTPTTVDTTKSVTKVSYNGGTAATGTYTLLQTGGKLVKYTKVLTTLNGLDKVKFQFQPQASVVLTGLTLNTTTNYEVYWDKTNNLFQISGQQDPTTFNTVPFATPFTMTIAQMQTAAPWGLWGWSQMLGGNFSISGMNANGSSVMSTLSGTTQVVTHTQDAVYPADFAALQGLKCLDQCPTAADIALSNAATTYVSPYAAGTAGWTGMVPGRALYAYTLNATTGNLMDAAATPAAVISTATTGNNAWGVRSGRLVAGADLVALNAAVTARNGTAGQYIEADIDALTTYYEWTTSGNNWDQLAILSDANGPVRFDPPLNVSFTVPAGTQYGTFAGANVVLEYGGFGDLWGIPSTCVDVSTNLSCTFGTGGTANNLQRWTPQFSIPSGSSVTIANTQGTVTSGTSYLVKALDKEVRLKKVAASNCATMTLTPVASSALPTATSWQDPTTIVGAAPTFTTPPAPRVIQGVKKY